MRDAPFKLRWLFFANGSPLARFSLGVGSLLAALLRLLRATLASWFLLGHRLLQLFAALGPSLGALLALLVEHLLRIDQLDVDPVSYTHLDVYKRQAAGRAVRYSA